ncbi:CdiA C-terminal domain-containing protein [Rhodothermus profundi]|uniref:tRNA nuclease CdiA C-terminal domain-containing protein n=1 Tax=Rhodothermus profundi TaxID=633813 RepID=A0A1M6UDC8_9BACT|nr:hypothetical protein [Rhodothermus profundi]SHK67173.1 hypothetical protein SAMN04488087_1656 [Rhodothermus profundi]
MERSIPHVRLAALEDLQTAAEVLRWAGADVARAASRIQEALLRELTVLLARDAPRRELERTARRHLERIIRRGERYMFTVANTALAGLDRIQSFSDAKQAGIQRFRYVGPPPIRRFCKEHYGKIYTLEEIKKLDNGQGLPVWIYGGGYNCRHRWVAVVEPLAADKIDPSQLRRMYRSASGAGVYVFPTTKPLAHELKLARMLAERLRKDVIFIPPSGAERTADALVGDEYWEFKTITTKAKNLFNAAYQHLREAKKKTNLHVVALFVDRKVDKNDIERIFKGIRLAVARDEKERIRKIYIIFEEERIIELFRQIILEKRLHEILDEIGI